MAEDGVDIAGEAPKVLTTDAVRESDVVITRLRTADASSVDSRAHKAPEG
jgi:protein-tyrosine-phosphatase